MEKKNPVDYFGWMVESVSESMDGRMTATIVGIPNVKSYIINGEDLERCINNRMNNNEEEKEKMSYRFEKEYEEFAKLRDSNRIGYNAMRNTNYKQIVSHAFNAPEIKDVIFNPPATIVFWTDGTKTVVKTQNSEEFDPEKGITMALFKKTHGNKGHYFEEIKKWTNKYKDETSEDVVSDPRWHIWYKIGMLDEIHCYEKDYSIKSGAVRRAKKLCNEHNITVWCVSQKAPFGPESDDAEWHFN